MKFSIGAALRSRLDPHGSLPPVQLRDSPDRLTYGRIITGTAFSWGRRVGSIMLSHDVSQFGEQRLKLDELRIFGHSGSLITRRAVELAMLTRSNEEGLALISDFQGVTADEVGMWQRFADAGIATIEVPFERRNRPAHGQSIFDGLAYAPPISLAE